MNTATNIPHFARQCNSPGGKIARVVGAESLAKWLGVVKFCARKSPRLAAGKMGYSTTQVGDLICENL